jgi:hypothetical protein
MDRPANQSPWYSNKLLEGDKHVAELCDHGLQRTRYGSQ